MSYGFGRFTAMFISQYLPSWIHMLIAACLTILSITAIIIINYIQLPDYISHYNKGVVLVIPSVILGFFVSVSQFTEYFQFTENKYR